MFGVEKLKEGYKFYESYTKNKVYRYTVSIGFERISFQADVVGK
jgi:hypothetical protein